MPNQIVIIKSYKSVGIGILLTSIFGPVGLFYASVTGGFFMTIAALLFTAYLVKGIFTDLGNMIFLQPFLMLSYGITSWIICIIWSIIAIRNYNNKLTQQVLGKEPFLNNNDANLRNDKSFEILNSNSQNFKIENPSDSANNSQPTFEEWCKNNPGKSINDYFKKTNRKL